MLYVTTRSETQIFTPQYALREQRGPDGGIFIPYNLIPYTHEELTALEQLSFNECLAAGLNRFLRAKISGQDLDMYCGRNPVRYRLVSRKILIAECCRNSDGTFSRFARDVGRVVCSDKSVDSSCTPLLDTIVRATVLIALYFEIRRLGIITQGETFDVSAVAGDFFSPVGILLVRHMGLPVENIVCCCNENSAVWNLFHQGEFRPNVRCVPTPIPEADVIIPDGLEAYIRLTTGTGETERFLDAIREGRAYFPCADSLDRMRKGLHVSVVSTSGILNTIPNVYSTSGILLSSHSALAYAGLLDYRARTKESRYGLVLAEKSSSADLTPVSRALNISQSKLTEILKTID